MQKNESFDYRRRRIHSTPHHKTFIKKYKLKNIVIDPVMVAKSGHRLISNNSINYLRKKLLPFALIVTPNIPEAETLIKKKIKTLDDVIKAGREILKFGPKFVLIKGGHANKSFIEDVLISKNNIKIFKKIGRAHV